MDSRQRRYLQGQPMTECEFDMNLAGEQSQESLSATKMDRSDGSGSSTNSAFSFSGTNYILSPNTLYAQSSPSENGSDLHEASAYRGETSTLSPRMGLESEQAPVVLPPFDIEKDGDPRIDWRMYYTFEVDKAEAYFTLQPGYLVTENYPAHIPRNSVKGCREHDCEVIGCKATPFTRHYDLERHFKSRHSAKGFVNCDYTKCPHKAALRKDHCREHYREYHNEDLIKRGDSNAQGFLFNKSDYMQPNWWRCSRCLHRVSIKKYAFKCGKCKTDCERERVAWRMENPPKSQTARSGSISNCGKCENMWLPDDSDPSEELWVSCPTCQPNIRTTRRL